jgi:hypothetical protein
LALKASMLKGGKLVIEREDASAICSLVKAWESCQERIRIHRNKPMPGVLKPEKAKPRMKATPSTLVAKSAQPLPASDPEAGVKAA